MPNEVIDGVHRMAQQEQASQRLLFKDQNHKEIPDLNGDDDDDSTYHPDEDDNDDNDDDNSGFDGNNEPNEPPIDDINPPGPAANGAVDNDTETSNDVPISDDEGSQGGTSTVTEDDNMINSNNDNTDDEGIAEGNNEAPEQGAATVTDQPNLDTMEPHVQWELQHLSISGEIPTILPGHT